jgi:2-polyprenyl-3-methyl-5-hydroxy-6-metoxy-1,4-benzoquinol methylase
VNSTSLSSSSPSSSSPSPLSVACDASLEARARQSLGSSSEAIYRTVAGALETYAISGGTLVDVGCGGGALWRVIAPRFSRYVGVDAVRYDAFPQDAEFVQLDLDAATWPVEDAIADVVTAVETIEHLENPWAFMRRLAAVAKPGGWVFVTTPNQLSGLSLLTLAVRNRFSAFHDRHFPTHRTALLESDLQRAAREAGLATIAIAYTLHSRIPLTPWHHPKPFAALFPRLLSDNVMLVARK